MQHNDWVTALRRSIECGDLRVKDCVSETSECNASSARANDACGAGSTSHCGRDAVQVCSAHGQASCREHEVIVEEDLRSSGWSNLLSSNNCACGGQDSDGCSATLDFCVLHRSTSD